MVCGHCGFPAHPPASEYHWLDERRGKQINAPQRTNAEEREHFDALARQYGPALSRYFRQRLRQQAGLARHLDVDDLVQEVWARLAVRQRGEPIDQPESYLFRAAANVWRDAMRRAQVRHSDVHDEYVEDRHTVEEDGPDCVLEGQEAINAIVTALAELPARTRQVFVLRRIEDMRQSAVARRLGISESAVEKHMMKAIRHLAAGPLGEAKP